MTTSSFSQQIEQKLRQAFATDAVSVIDNSYQHAGHGASGGHYTVNIISTEFVGKPLIARHRMVYAAMGDWMKAEIHALNIDARTPTE